MNASLPSFLKIFHALSLLRAKPTRLPNPRLWALVTMKVWKTSVLGNVPIDREVSSQYLTEPRNHIKGGSLTAMQLSFPGSVPVTFNSDECVGDFLLGDAVFVDIKGHHTALLVFHPRR